ncbi:MAG: hypothetical protein EXS59_01810 [Candidatus Taylorbacteria bacterium]|nr:hypothetical protein [Candidatus Taylorbacteria bacterium]
MKNKKNIVIEPIGLVKASGLTSLAVLLTLKVADMWNYWIPELHDSLIGKEKGYIGLAEIISTVSMVELGQELSARGWAFAPANLFLGGKTEDGRWVFPQLGQDFTVLNAPKSFAGKPDHYPWMQVSEGGIRAFTLTVLSDIFSDTGEVKTGIRFPILKIGK